MALKVADGFDSYSVQADANSGGTWTATGTVSFSTTGARNSSKGLRVSTASSYLTAAFAAASTTGTIYVAASFSVVAFEAGAASTLRGHFIHIWNGATKQITIHFDDSATGGSIKIYRGGTSQVAADGTLIATYSSAFVAGTVAHFQFKIVIDPTTGSVSVRKDGATSDTFSATALNTRGAANVNVDSVSVGGMSASIPDATFDDFFCNDSSGSFNNTWPGDLRCVTTPVSADTAQKDFAASPSAMVSYNPGTTSTAQSANVARGQRCVAGYSGTVSGARVPLFATFTGNIRAYIYADNGSNGPGTLLASSNTITNAVIGNVDFTFSSPPAVVRGTTYHLVVTADASWTPSLQGTTGTSYSASAVTPTSAPNNPTTSSTAAAGMQCSLVHAFPANADALDALNDGDASYTSSSTLNALDLFDFANLASTPVSIAAVAVRAFARKSDSGTRGLSTVLKSGATTDVGTNLSLSTSYQGTVKTYETDPNTSAAWTMSGVSAAQAGYKLTA